MKYSKYPRIKDSLIFCIVVMAVMLFLMWR